VNWDADFAGSPPIELPDGRKLETLAKLSIGNSDGLGSVRSGKLVKSQVGNLRDKLRAAGVSLLTTRKVLGTLSRVLEHQIAQPQPRHSRRGFLLSRRRKGHLRRGPNMIACCITQPETGTGTNEYLSHYRYHTRRPLDWPLCNVCQCRLKHIESIQGLT